MPNNNDTDWNTAYGGRFSHVSDPNRAAYMAKEWKSAGSPNAHRADMSNYDPDKNYNIRARPSPLADRYNLENYAPEIPELNEQKIRERTQEQIQAQLDTLDAAYESIFADVAQEREEGLGRTRAIGARAGLIGSPMGAAQKTQTKRHFGKIKAGYESELAAKKAQVMTKGEQRADDLIAARKGEIAEAREDYRSYLEGIRSDARSDMEVYFKAGGTVNEFSDDEYAQMLNQTGWNPDQMSLYEKFLSPEAEEPVAVDYAMTKDFGLPLTYIGTNVADLPDEYKNKVYTDIELQNDLALEKAKAGHKESLEESKHGYRMEEKGYEGMLDFQTKKSLLRFERDLNLPTKGFKHLKSEDDLSYVREVAGKLNVPAESLLARMEQGEGKPAKLYFDTDYYRDLLEQAKKEYNKKAGSGSGKSGAKVTEGMLEDYGLPPKYKGMLISDLPDNIKNKLPIDVTEEDSNVPQEFKQDVTGGMPEADAYLHYPGIDNSVIKNYYESVGDQATYKSTAEGLKSQGWTEKDVKAYFTSEYGTPLDNIVESVFNE